MEDEDIERLRFENELKKLKLSAETGAKFGQTEGGQLPPGLEAQWLTNIEAFEKAYGNATRRKLRDILGYPELKSPNEISDEQLPTEMERLYDLLSQHSISLSCIYEVSDRELYRFIVEEFLEKETDDMKVPGMVHCFIYEDYCPNYPEDIKKDARVFLESLGRDSYEFFHYPLHSVFLFQGQELKDEVLSARMEQHMNGRKLKLRELDLKEPEMSGEVAHIEGWADYAIHYPDGSIVEIGEKVSFRFVFAWDFWRMDHASIPRLDIG
jgi:hypothetical protein